MFTNELAETHQQIATINYVDPDALEALINYAYTSKLEIRVNTVENLLTSACLLQVNMKKQLHPSDSLGIRAFADAHGCDQLFKDNFSEVCKNKEFLLLIKFLELMILMFLKRRRFYMRYYHGFIMIMTLEKNNCMKFCLLCVKVYFHHYSLQIT